MRHIPSATQYRAETMRVHIWRLVALVLAGAALAACAEASRLPFIAEVPDTVQAPPGDVEPRLVPLPARAAQLRSESERAELERELEERRERHIEDAESEIEARERN